MTMTKRIKDIFPDAFAAENPTGFFTYLDTWALAHEIEIPWMQSPMTSRYLDIAYHGNNNEKIISPMLDSMTNGEPISAATAFIICGMWYSVFGVNLTKEYEIMQAEYNPLNNYDMSESGTDGKSGTHSQTNSGGETTTRTGKQKVTTDNTHSVYGFDSSTPANADKSGGYIETEYGNNNAPITDNTQRSSTESGSESETVSHEFERHGNIGVMSSQELLEKEIALWEWNFYNNFLFPCVNKSLTIPIY